MCGLPRSGKSSWIKKNKNGAVVICADEVRKEIFGHQFHQQANKFVFAIVEAMASIVLKQGMDVIIDATHVTESVRLPWAPIIGRYKADAFIVWVYAEKDPKKNLEICLERNKTCPEDEQLPEQALRNMAAMFESPAEVRLFEPSAESKLFTVIEYRNKQIKK